MVADFASVVAETVPHALRAERIEVLQVNIGLRCNMACGHCHQSCSPSRDEMMEPATMREVVRVAREISPTLVDITGGAPELHPHIRDFVEELHAIGAPVQLRTNLTALLEPEADGLIELLASRSVRVLASLPGTSAEDYAAERGPAFERALVALRRLSSAGYGAGERQRLDIAFNPRGAEDPGDVAEVCARFRSELTEGLGIEFADLIVIANMPVGRLRERLDATGRLDAYLYRLQAAFNPDTLPHLSCRTGIEVAWDGTLSDCDFNLGRGMRTHDGVAQTVFDFDLADLAQRPIRFGDHCYVCAAAFGSG